MDQAHAEQLSMVMDPLDRVPVQLEFGDHGRGKVDPARAKLRVRGRLLTGLSQEFKQSLLLGIDECHRLIVAPNAIRRRSEPIAERSEVT